MLAAIEALIISRVLLLLTPENPSVSSVISCSNLIGVAAVKELRFPKGAPLPYLNPSISSVVSCANLSRLVVAFCSQFEEEQTVFLYGIRDAHFVPDLQST
jgi:hypothetical protein